MASYSSSSTVWSGGCLSALSQLHLGRPSSSSKDLSSNMESNTAEQMEHGTDPSRLNEGGKEETSAAKRHVWKYKVKAQAATDKGTVEVTYPFVNDNNDQDYLLSKALIVEAPYAKQKSLQLAWENFHRKLIGTKDFNGQFPFINIKLATVKSRFAEYKKLRDMWFDKNGSGIDDGKDDENDDYLGDKTDDGKDYAIKIRKNVCRILIEIDDLEEEKKAKDSKAKSDEVLEENQVEVIKNRCLGKIMASRFLEAPSNSSSEKEKSGSDNEKKTPKVSASRAKAAPPDIVDLTAIVDRLEQGSLKRDATMKEIQTQKIAYKEKVLQEKRRKTDAEDLRLKEAAALEAKRIENESKRLQIQENQTNMQLQLMAEMMQMMKKDRGL